jgi:hypothetical protein
MTLSIMGLFVTLRITPLYHYAEGRFLVSYAECRYAECCYAEFRYAECHYAGCRYAECRYAACHGVKEGL